jgi:hypothetical protein
MPSEDKGGVSNNPPREFTNLSIVTVYGSKMVNNGALDDLELPLLACCRNNCCSLLFMMPSSSSSRCVTTQSKGIEAI